MRPIRRKHQTPKLFTTDDATYIVPLGLYDPRMFSDAVLRAPERRPIQKSMMFEQWGQDPIANPFNSGDWDRTPTGAAHDWDRIRRVDGG